MRLWTHVRGLIFKPNTLAITALLALTSALVPLAAFLWSGGVPGWALLVPVIGAGVAALAVAFMFDRFSVVQEALDVTRSAIVVYDKEDRLVLANRRYREVLGVPKETFVPGAPYRELLHRSLERTMPEADIPREMERRLRVQTVADGQPSDRVYPGNVWLRVTKTRTPSGANIGVAIDVTELYELRGKLEAEMRRFMALAESAPVGICQIDSDAEIHFANSSLLEMLNASDPSELAGDTHSFRVDGVVIAGFRGLTRHLFSSPMRGEAHVHFIEEGRDVLVKKAFVRGRERLHDLLPPSRAAGENILIFIDVTERARAEAKIRFLATHDALTGALNRVAFVEDLATAAAEATTTRLTTLISIDLDRFKPVNDAYGHAIGDELLRVLVVRGEAFLRPNMRLYRIGGDEFAILCRGAAEDELVAFANDLVDQFRTPVLIDGHSIVVGASVGVSALPRDADSPEALVHYADLALYHVKNAGGGGVMVFDKAVLNSTDSRLLMEFDLAAALEHHDFRLVFQPVFGLDGDRAIGMEALVRWRNRRTGEPVPPATFIPIAESTNLISRIDFEVFTLAIEQFAAWLEAGSGLDMLLLNMSVRTLEAPGVVDHVADTLIRCRVPGRSVTIELTESFAVQSVSSLTQTIRAINNCGVRFAIDDFGTGYTSLRLLADLPISFVKIDQSFVRDIAAADHRGAQSVVRAILDMAHHMDIGVIAEGVETEEELETLKRLGCIRFQGHLLGAPAPAEAYADATVL
ncbi:EAL domain-containing protein [Acuticoccus sp. M5D2P5]|uniref:putative bifunctional diguanylate cyclase/phosphodiesterase n=1 Tax=Acuticoccus kalidii TaxID=2910977 RepID=UPI001F24E116|nr:EAL domain-containing protein [Acuticoccus kalidii]MCF3933886.1 EAL domain-containing protein [Acuticoccus kalidii]